MHFVHVGAAIVCREGFDASLGAAEEGTEVGVKVG